MEIPEREKEEVRLSENCPTCGSSFCTCSNSTAAANAETELQPSTTDTAADLQDTDGALATKIFEREHAQSSSPVGAVLLAEGQVVANRYKILAQIGEGGMGSVYKAQDLFLKRTVALKLLHSEIAQKPVLVQRFQKEVEATAKLAHDGIVKVQDMGLSESGAPFMVMDLIDGKGLDEILKEKGHLPVEESLRIAHQIADAIGHAHERGVVHRDLKPSNVIVLKDASGKSTIKIVDFGIAKLLESEGENDKLTKTGDIFGSPQYMSPEQCRGEALDQRADIYSIGCVLFEMLTGKTAFCAENAVQTILKHLNEARPELDKKLAVPSSVVAIIDKCLEKKKEERYGSCTSLKSDIEKAASGKSVKTRSKFLKGKRAAVLAGSILMIALLAYIAVTIPRTAEQIDRTQGPATLIGSSWHEIDRAGQLSLNKGNLEQAEKTFNTASTLPSADGAEKMRSFRKLALLSHMKSDRRSEAKYDKKADAIGVALNKGALTARKALIQAISLLPSKISEDQRSAVDGLVMQLGELSAEDIKNSTPGRSIPMLTSAINKLSKSLSKDDSLILSLYNWRSLCYTFANSSGKGMKDAAFVTSNIKSTAPPGIKAGALLSRAFSETSAGSHENAKEIAAQILAQTGSLKETEREIMNAQANFLLGLLNLDEGKSAEAGSFLNKATQNESSVEAIAPMLYWHLQREVSHPEIFEQVLKKVLADSSLTADAKIRADYLSLLGDLYYRQKMKSGQPVLAAPFLKEALELRQSYLSPDSKKVRYSARRLVALLSFQGKTGKADDNDAELIPIANQWIAAGERDPDEDKNDLAQAYNYAAQAYLINGNTKLGSQAFQKMFDLTVENPQSSFSFDEFFYSHANQFLSSEKLTRLEPYLKSRIDLAQKNKDFHQLWQAQDDLGHYYYLNGRMQEAGNLIESAAKSISSSDMQGWSGRQIWQAAETVDNYAMYLRKIGDPNWQTYQKKAEKMRYGNAAEQ
ncbi:MAG: protein kinase [Candidatus Melainabacteria bacterium]|nr:protein kinase [Candidatus Melainabacteria bacterium]